MRRPAAELFHVLGAQVLVGVPLVAEPIRRAGRKHCTIIASPFGAAQPVIFEPRPAGQDQFSRTRRVKQSPQTVSL